MNSSKKTILISAVIIIAALIVFFYVSGQPSGDGSQLTTTTNTSQATGARVLSLLSQINSLAISADLFKDQVFLTLKDFSVTIPEQGVKRDNPFAPIPGVYAPGTAPDTTIKKTK